MAYDDRYGGRDRDRTDPRYEHDDERGFFERMGDWFSGREDERDAYRSPYRPDGDNRQQRPGPDGGPDYRENYGRGAGYGRFDQDAYGRRDRPSRQQSERFARDDRGYGGVTPPGSDYVGGSGAELNPYRAFSGNAPDPDLASTSRSESYARNRAIMEQYRRTHPDDRRFGGRERDARHDHDPHYSEWRQRQIDALDRDYDDYRRENAARFDSEFGTWRTTRQGQRQSLGRVAEHMDVVGSDGTHVGTVDKVRGDRLVMTRSDPSAGGHHHSVPLGWIDKVDDKVVLNRTAEAAQSAWRDEETSRALFEREDSGSEGPHILGRSFSGTYRDE